MPQRCYSQEEDWLLSTVTSTKVGMKCTCARKPEQKRQRGLNGWPMWVRKATAPGPQLLAALSKGTILGTCNILAGLEGDTKGEVKSTLSRVGGIGRGPSTCAPAQGGSISEPYQPQRLGCRRLLWTSETLWSESHFPLPPQK